MDYVLNEVVPMEDEAEITFGTTEQEFLVWVYNLCISFPTVELFLALADVKACFRFGRIHADLTGAFGFLADTFYCLATAMVFGSNTSALSWEPFRRSIVALTPVFFQNEQLVVKHAALLLTCCSGTSSLFHRALLSLPFLADSIEGFLRMIERCRG